MNEKMHGWMDGLMIWVKNSSRHTKCRKDLNEFSMKSFMKCLWMDEMLWDWRNVYMEVGMDGMFAKFMKCLWKLIDEMFWI
jgi:hypothetical protein